MMTGKKKLLILILAIIVVAFLAALLLLSKSDGNNDGVKEEATGERPFHMAEIKEELKQGTDEEDLVEKAESNEKDGENVVAAKRPPAVESSEYERCLMQVKEFCNYLDSRDYVKTYEVEEGTYLRMLAVIERLMKKEPFVVAETMDIRRIISNIYHFYRVLGKEDVLLAAEIMRRERERLEDVMALCHRWLILDMQQENPQTEVSIEELYNYGAFFLSTLGGSSYLARRDSRTSFLVRYYSLLFVDLADRQTKNHYGLDIVQIVERLSADMELIGGLERRGEYQAGLKEIRERLIKRQGGIDHPDSDGTRTWA